MESIISNIDSFLKEAEKAFSYERLFDLSGITDVLEKMYIVPRDLNKSYIDIFYKMLRDFISQPLYSDISLNSKEDLKFIREDDLFVKKIEETVDKIKKELDSRSVRVMNELENYSSHEEISLADFSKAVRLDKSSLLFILSDLKDEGVIYDYNGREITTK